MDFSRGPIFHFFAFVTNRVLGGRGSSGEASVRVFSNGLIDLLGSRAGELTGLIADVASGLFGGMTNASGLLGDLHLRVIKGF